MVSLEDILSSNTSSDTTNSIMTFVSSVCINVFIGLLIFLVFSVLRPRLRRVYAPRTYAVEQGKRSEPVPSGLFAWIPAALRVPDQEIIKRSGLDTYMFLRSIRTMFIMFTVISVLSALTILPVNILGTMGQKGLNSLSLGNVDPKSAWLWVHVGFFATAVAWTLRTIVGELRIYTHLRMWWLTHPDNASRAGASMVLVSHIPKCLDESGLADLFDVFPGGVRQVLINRSSNKVAKIIKKRDELARKLEKLLTKYALQCTRAQENAVKHNQVFVQPPRPTFRKPIWGLPLGTQAEVFEYYASEIAMCNHYIAQSGKTLDKFTRQPSALVMFNRQVAAHMAAQTVLDYEPLSMTHVSVDVHPDDVIWSNLKMSPWDKRIRGYVSFVISTGITIVWTIITAVLSSLVQVDNLARLDAFKWLKSKSNSWALGVFSGMVPSLVLALLMTILPWLLRLLLRLEGTARKSQINLRLLHRLFFFQVWNVYLVTIFSSSILVIAVNSINSPENIIHLVQTQVPQSATNILTYVLLLAFVGAAKEIIQGVQLALRYLIPMVCAKTPRAIYEAEQPSEFDWGQAIPTHSLVFLMGFSYSFIAPIVDWFVMVYFGLFYLIYRYQFLYVYNDKTWVTGGLSFPKSVKQMLVAIYISEVYMVLMMVSKISSSVSSIMRIVVAVAILLLTIVMHLYINDVYMPAINYLPVKKAVDIEHNPRLASEFPNVVGSRYENEQQKSLLDTEQARARNRIYAMYSSLVPRSLIDMFLWTFPNTLKPSHSAIGDNNGWDRLDDEEAATITHDSHTYNFESRKTRAFSMIDRRPQANMNDTELASAFANPAMRAKPVCNLWVPLANAKLFARLLWEIEYYGQGTILVITDGTRISEKFKIEADLEFALEEAEVSDKNELSWAQRNRPTHI
ncbi:phosphate metabolism protein 7 [Coemansia spiralis]|uniref:Phosphate metabolism protein 7 n=2 Tax=Coemansia TaxID=4863 RepID=A0A9W8GB00_9FUNG|nr:phosphate metabolism protein 7 [Coemansia umbellata]KAJ2625163.1 phosphate metabolism protein 7 [Coemansia sp. RSA 1358]KAJ2679883.1 phosphate metabolism protein 7 [Coemansia spiralis]